MKLFLHRITAVALVLGALWTPIGARAQSLPAAPAALSTYIVQLTEPPLAEYAGGQAGLAPTNPQLLGQRKLDAASSSSAAYRAFLASRQAAAVDGMSAALGRSVEVLYHYDAALNGVAVRLNPAEAAAVAGLPGVRRVVADQVLTLLTDVGPAWIGATGIWDGTDTGGLGASKGEGIVVGIIDTGINHDHPSFADIGGDGYNHTNPRGQYYGICTVAVILCNDKLIGIYDYLGGTGEDDNEHGSHTASTTAGNVLTATVHLPTLTLTRTISGVAPHANIIAYRACATPPTLPDPGPALGGCLSSQTLLAINQATLDQVDVINYSISGGADPYNDLVSDAFLSARTAGIFVSAAAGNEGPGPSTTSHNEPWTLAVAAETHNRKYVNTLADMAGGSTTPPADMSGAGVTSGYGPAQIVYAGAAPYNDPLCENSTGGTYSGQIVVCDRGTNGRVEKSQNVLAAGAGGFVLANDQASGDSLVGDAYALPGVHITYADGVTLKAWIAAGAVHTATITGAVVDTTPANGDIIASFSSRGPAGTLPGVLKPDITAPGVDVLAAINSASPIPGPDPEFGFLSGTSMAAPHAAGAAALLIAIHPEWSPAEVQSALMTTAFTGPRTGSNGVHPVLDTDGVSLADPFAMGAGRIDLSLAARAGLVLDESEANYTAANPSTNGDPTSLNLASLANGACSGICSWTRVFSSTLGASRTWTASTNAPAGLAVTVAPSVFTLDPGESVSVTITAHVGAVPINHWYFASFSLHAAGSPDSRLPIALYAIGNPATDVRPVLYMHGNPDDGCSGTGTTDVAGCDGPFLLKSSVFYTGTAASWTVANPATTDAAYRSLTTPNWIWNLDYPTTLSGTMTVEWWAECGTCGGLVGTADWVIRIWADGTLAYEQRVTATPGAPATAARLTASIDLPYMTATSDYVLHIEPVYVDTQNNTKIYYDSTGACPDAAGSGPCDSLVRMPVLYLLRFPIVTR